MTVRTQASLCLCSMMAIQYFKRKTTQLLYIEDFSLRFICNLHVIVCILCISDAGGWWHARFNGREGLMPNNYIEKI